MASVLTYVINGALTGLLYALTAMTFVIIYRSARVFNFAQGEIIVVGAFLIWTFASEFDLEWWIAVPLALASSLVLGLVIERVFLRPLVGEDLFSFVMVTIALLILIRGVVLVVGGGRRCASSQPSCRLPPPASAPSSSTRRCSGAGSPPL